MMKAIPTFSPTGSIITCRMVSHKHFHLLMDTLSSNCLRADVGLIRRLAQVDGQKYNGEGRSKKTARIQAAATALRSFIQFKDGAVLTPTKPTSNVDFTSDEHLENGECWWSSGPILAILKRIHFKTHRAQKSART